MEVVLNLQIILHRYINRILLEYGKVCVFSRHTVTQRLQWKHTKMTILKEIRKYRNS
jgi:hypothetical protein